MDVKEKIEEIAAKLTKDPNLKSQFQKDPVKTVESLLGVDLPDEAIEKIASGVKGKLSVDAVSGAIGNLKKLF